MGGKMSRDKGSRVERLLRDHLRELGYESFRVPLSGASQGYKGDVVGTKDGKTTVFEVKARKELFASIYDWLGLSRTKHVAINDGTLPVNLVSISYDLISVLDNSIRYTTFVGGLRLEGKILNLKKFLGTADILAIKDNGRPFLFLRFQ